jgi:hypothetical protein
VKAFRFGRRAAAVFLSVVYLVPSLAYGGGLLLKGRILDQYDRPLPGCLVSVASTKFRSHPVFTDSNGYFEALAPAMSDQSTPASPLPYLEIYWNAEVIFRQPLTVFRAVSTDKDWDRLLKWGGSADLGEIRVGSR